MIYTLVLIFCFQQGISSVTIQPFNTKESCEQAASQAKKDYTGLYNPRTICIAHNEKKYDK